MDWREWIERIASIPAPAGGEAARAQEISRIIETAADEIASDAMGNLIVRRRGTRPEKLMLSAHLDQPGMIITFAEPDGMLRFSALGKAEPLALINTEMVFGEVRGVVTAPAGIALDSIKCSDLMLDIGASDREEAMRLLPPGSAGCPAGILRRRGSRVMAPAIGTSICAALLCSLAERKPLYDTYFVFTAQSGLGARGAKTAAFAIEPDFCVEVAPAAENSTFHRGGGVGIQVSNRCALSHPRMVRALADAAAKAGQRVQLLAAQPSASDLFMMQSAGSGAFAAGISLAVAHLDTVAECADLRDAEAVKQSLCALLDMEID